MAERPPSAIEEFAFAPDAARARKLDRAVRQGLAESLVRVLSAVDPPRGRRDRPVQRLLGALRASPVRPGLFARYVELVLAIFEERPPAELDALASDLLRPRRLAARSLQVCTLTDAALGAGQAARYQRLLASDIGFAIAPLAAAERGAARRAFAAALELLRAGAPDAFAEFSALIREVVLVRPGADAAGKTFGAASSFSLWGAVVINSYGVGGRVSLAAQLAHEAAHTLLFGLARGGRITENEDAERYPSPLRSDQRPMEGVAHATFVAGRMIHALDQMLASGLLTEAEAAATEAHVAQLERLQGEGLATVRAHARLAPAGEAAFAALDAFRRTRTIAAAAP